MENMAILIDVAKCTACRSCQVACKSWNQLKAEKTENRGTHENPPDLSPHTWNRIRWVEQLKNGKISWSFFSERCRHCDQPDCQYLADSYIEGAVLKDASGAVIFTDKIKQIDPEEFLGGCRFGIPRHDPANGMFYKCNMCLDRITAGLPPACVKACSTGALRFGTKEEMLKAARAGMTNGQVLYPGEEYNTLWILPDESMLDMLAVRKAPNGLVKNRSAEAGG